MDDGIGRSRGEATLFGPCTGAYVAILLIAAVAGFGGVIVWLGSVRLAREAKHPVWPLIFAAPLFSRGRFGETLETPRRRLAGLAGVVFFLVAVDLLLVAAQAAVCR